MTDKPLAYARRNRPNLTRLPCTCSLLGISRSSSSLRQLARREGKTWDSGASSTRIPDDRCKLPAALSAASLSSLAARQGTATPRQLADHFLIFPPSLPPVAQVMHQTCSTAVDLAPPFSSSKKRRSCNALQPAQKRCAHAAAGATRGKLLDVAEAARQPDSSGQGVDVRISGWTRPARLFSVMPSYLRFVDSRLPHMFASDSLAYLPSLGIDFGLP